MPVSKKQVKLLVRFYFLCIFTEDSVVIEDATIERFHTTFHFEDPILNGKEKEGTDDATNKEIQLLKKELEHTKRNYEELKEKQKKEGNLKCGTMPVQKCQV